MNTDVFKCIQKSNISVIHIYYSCLLHVTVHGHLLLFQLFLLTDNVFALKSWTKKKFAFDDSRIDKAFGIPEEFDYMD